MANEHTTGRKQEKNATDATDATDARKATRATKATQQDLGTVPAAASSKSGKNNKNSVGGRAVPGARSTQPRKFTENANPQQQQLESYNRDMRRRMERMGYNDNEQRVKTIQDQRKKRAERLKQRRQEQVAHVKRALPGGKIDTNPRRVYIMVAVVAVALIALIAIFAILRANGIV